MTQRWQRWLELWPLLLAAAYLALIPVLSRVEDVPGVTYLLAGSAVACFIVWCAWRESSSTLGMPALLGRGIDAVRRLPGAILWLPLPVSLSWVAATMARVRPPFGDYDTALGLWLGALVLFVAIFVVPIAVENRDRLPALVRGIPWPEVAIVSLITAFAFAVRFVDLAAEPSPFWDDEGEQAIAALEVIRGVGVRDNLFDMGVGTAQPTMYYGTLALSFKIFGTSVMAARLPAVLVGAATIPVLYLMLRELFDRRVALVGVAFLAVLHFHVHYSRLAFPNNYDTLFAALMLLFAFRAIRTGKTVDFALSGLVAGLALYFYQGARVIPVVLVILLAYLTVKTFGLFLVQRFWGLAALVTGFVVVSLPAALFWNEHRGAASSRWGDQNIFDSGWLDREVELTGHSELHVVWDQIQEAFGTLVVYGDTIAHYNSGVPLLDGVSATVLLIGGVYALFHIFQPRFLSLFALLVLPIMLGSALLDPPIGSQRFLATAPVAAAFVGLGLVIAGEALVQMAPPLRRVAPIGVAAVLLVIAVMNLSFYFDTYLPSDNFGRGRNASTAQVADILEPFDDNYAVYFLEIPGFHPRERSLVFRSSDKVLVDVADGGRSSITFDGGLRVGVEEAAASARASRRNALFLVPVATAPGRNSPATTGRSAELQKVEELCPSGVRSDVYTTPNMLISYVIYDVPNAKECIRRLEGAVLPSSLTGLCSPCGTKCAMPGIASMACGGPSFRFWRPRGNVWM